MDRKVFLLYSKDDEANLELERLKQDVTKTKQFTLAPYSDFELENETNRKKIILECDIFFCCLSLKFYESNLIDIVKFAHCIARKTINTFYLEDEKELFKKMEDQIKSLDQKYQPKKRFMLEVNRSFFGSKTVKYTSIDQIKVNIFYMKKWEKKESLISDTMPVLGGGGSCMFPKSN